MQDIRQQTIIAIRWLPLILVVALAAGGVAYAYSSSQAVSYEATGALRVDAGPEASTQDYAVAREALAQYARECGLSRRRAGSHRRPRAIREPLEPPGAHQYRHRRRTTDSWRSALRRVTQRRRGELRSDWATSYEGTSTRP